MTRDDLVLEAQGLHVSYGAEPALDDVSFALTDGVTALVGPNGAGKSTLMRVVAGVQRPRSGTVSFRDQVVAGRHLSKYQRALGYLPQNPSWHGWMSASDVVRSFAWMRAVPRGQVADRTSKALAEVGLADRAQVRADRLSGGQFQRLMLATAIVHDPRVLILDEPSVGLDPEQRQLLRGLLGEHGRDRATLVSTHLLDDVATGADRVLVLSEGRIVFDGSPGNLVQAHGDTEVTSATEMERAYIGLLRATGTRR